MKTWNIKQFLIGWFAFVFLLSGAHTLPVSAASHVTMINASTQTISPTSVKVSWTAQKDAAQWKVQKAVDKEGNAGQFHTVATIRRNCTSYTVKGLKKNTQYYFRVIGYKKVNGKLVKAYETYENDVPGYAGISVPVWDEYCYAEAWCSSGRIDLWLYNTNEFGGVKPLYCQIYRKKAGASDGAYKKIAQVRASNYIQYKDRSVKAGQSYIYRARNYAVINHRKVYSQWSDTLRRSAVLKEGIFSAKKISVSKDGKELIVRLTSDKKYNGDLILNQGVVCAYKDDDDLDDNHKLFLLSAYSTNGKTWTKISGRKEITLKGGKSLYLKFTGESDAAQVRYVLCNTVSYNDVPTILEIPLGGRGKTENNNEAIH